MGIRRYITLKTIIIGALFVMVGVITGVSWLVSAANNKLNIWKYHYYVENSEISYPPVGSIKYLVWVLDVGGTVDLVSVSLDDYDGFAIEDIFYVYGTPHQTTDEELSKVAGNVGIRGLTLSPAPIPNSHYIVVRIRIIDEQVSGPHSARIDYKWLGISAKDIFSVNR